MANPGWSQLEYRITALPRRELAALEELAALHLAERRISRETFATFCNTDSPELQIQDGGGSTDSDDATLTNSATEESASSSETDLSTASSTESSLVNSSVAAPADSSDCVTETSKQQRLRSYNPAESTESSEPVVILKQHRTLDHREECVESRRVTLRRMLVNPNDQTKSQAPRSINTNHSPQSAHHSDESDPSISIDPAFEESLTQYAKKWLTSFCIYKGERIYFDSNAYVTFLSLEGRISFDEPVPPSGNYTLSSIEYNLIGSIPYLSLILNNRYSINYYEYPNGTGILCLSTQHTLRGKVSLVTPDGLVSGSIRHSDGLMIEVGSTWYLRTALVVGRKDLSVQLINYEPRFRLLFGRIRNRTSIPPQLEWLNYETVNSRLACRAYRTGAQLIQDLELIQGWAQELTHELAEYSKRVLLRVREELAIK